MKTGVGHIQFNVSAENVPYCKDLLIFLGWETLFEDNRHIGLGGKNGESFWFVGEVKDVANDYDGPGVNHIAIAAESAADVDAAASYLTGNGVALLFATPRHRPDFASSELDTYYQVMFETPDKLLLEIVYTGPK